MKLSELLQKYGISREKYNAILAEEFRLKPRSKQFFIEHTDGSEPDGLAVRAAEEILIRHGIVGIQTDTEQENTDPVIGGTQEEIKDFMNRPVEKDSNADEMETQEAKKENKTEKPAVKKEDTVERTVKKTLKKKKKTTSVPVPVTDTDIDMVPGAVLRHFLAESCNLRLEKLCFMDDEAVRTMVNDKFIVWEREQNYAFIKRSATIFTVSKSY